MAKQRKLKSAPKLGSTDPVILELWVYAGGRCEFQGCPEYLLRDKLTTNTAKLADIAHIVARTIDGPRGDDPLPLSQRNKIDNLFLACTKHHRLIDKKSMVTKYPKDVLTQYKQAHEERIRFVTGLGDERETMVLRMMGNIRGNTVSISKEDIRKAVLGSSQRYPRYLGSELQIEIDLSVLLENDLNRYWQEGINKIQDIIDRRLIPAIQKNEVRHLSIFALARIPFLAYLGYAIGDKVPVDIYQKQRNDDQGWNLQTNQTTQHFEYHKDQGGTDPSSVAVTISISGEIVATQIPQSIDQKFTIYSIRPSVAKPDRSIITSKESIDEFKRTYARLLREIETIYPSAKSVHIFPAVPITAALFLGRELLKDVSPSLVIYDIGPKGFEQAIVIDSYKKG